MERMDDLDRLSGLINSRLRRGVRTNNTLSAEDYRREMAAGSLYAHLLDGGLLLLRRRAGYWLLNYYLAPGAEPFALPVEGRMVVELPFRPKDAPVEGELLALFRASGFHETLRRVRLERPAGAAEAVGTEFRFRRGTEEELPGAMELLAGCFDPVTGCLPSEEALKTDILAGNLTCALDREGKLAGLLHGSRGRAAAEIRHLAVRPDLRGRGCGRGLIAAWLESVEHGNTKVWTGADNAAALGTYGSAGYRRDGWYSVVMTGAFPYQDESVQTI